MSKPYRTHQDRARYAPRGQSWKERLVDLKARGLSIAPDIAVGDGALGFWKALDEALPPARLIDQPHPRVALNMRRAAARSLFAFVPFDQPPALKQAA